LMQLWQQYVETTVSTAKVSQLKKGVA